MTTRERREYSSNVVRTLSPVGGSSQHKVDHNLDHLLDDLQTSVERTKSKDVRYRSPVNTTTVVRERSISPGGGESRRVYKTAHYEYSSNGPQTTTIIQSGGNAPPLAGQPNITSLDSLLQDLKHERERSLERIDTSSYSNVGIDDGLLEPSAHVAKTTKITTYSGGSTLNNRPLGHNNNAAPSSVARELNFDSPGSSSHRTTTTVQRESRSRHRSPPPPQQHISSSSHFETTRNVSARDLFESDPTVDRSTASSTINRTHHYNTAPQQLVPYNEFVDDIDGSSTLPAELSGLPLDSAILPGPGTKVTTTIKTFTYEIPGDAPAPNGGHPGSAYHHYKHDTFNTNTLSSTSDRAVSPVPPPSGGQPGNTHYRNETYSSSQRHIVEPPAYGSPVPPRRSVSPRSVPAGPPQHQSVLIKRETHNSSSTTYPDGGHPAPSQPQQPGSTTTTHIYRSDVNNTSNTIRPRPASPVYEPAPQSGPKQTYLYKREVTNTKNTVYGPPGGRLSPTPRDYSPVPIAAPTSPPNNTTIVYNYSSTNTSNTRTGPDDSRQPLLPFPVDGNPTSQVDGNPPKRLDDLLATFGDTNGHGPQHRGGLEEPYTPRKEINTALATGKAEPLAEPKQTMKPLAGPPVYYPQGNKEMFTKSEQSEAGWRAQGGWAKASGNYEYEAASKSKSSSKSGAAVVPVCLPLCCAMPCTIM